MKQTAKNNQTDENYLKNSGGNGKNAERPLGNVFHYRYEHVENN